MVEYYFKILIGDIVCLNDEIYVIREERLLCYLIKCVKNVVISKNFIFCEFNYCYKIK